MSDFLPHSLPPGEALSAHAAAPRRLRVVVRSLVRALVLALGLATAGAGAAAADLAWGPFRLNGFLKTELSRTSNVCEDCQLYPGENKQRVWADPLRYGASYGAKTSSVTLFQPFLSGEVQLGQGWRLSGLLSQRWRDGDPDVPGFLFERNLALSHEDWGSVRAGAMSTRSWSVADFPYGTHIGVSNAWSGSGAGYGLLTRALRVMARPLDVFEGDLVLEATYDAGESGWNKNKPRLLELYAQYVKGDLVVDAIYQDARNGTPSSWGQTPFTGLTPFAQDDLKLGQSGQSIALLMARYQLDARWEVSGGIRANRWSGAYARVTGQAPGQPFDLWNNMFNVDWNCAAAAPPRCAVDNPGYPARSVDLMAGVRYRVGQWTLSTGMVYLGQAKTDNPSDRGQHNAMLLNAFGINRKVGHGLELYAMAGLVRYRQQGLSPMSMPAHEAFSGIDSRAAQGGNWFGVGATFTF